MSERMVSVCCEAEPISELDGTLGQCSRCGENTTFEPDTWTEEEIASIKADMDYAEWKEAGKPGRIGAWHHAKNL